MEIVKETESVDMVEAALARGIARVTDPAILIEGQAEAILRHHATWAEHIPPSRLPELAAALDACAEEMREPIRRYDQEGMRRVGSDWWRKIVALSTPIVEPTQSEQHERAIQQVWGHGQFNCAFEVSIVFDKVIKLGERIVQYDHRGVTFADEEGRERIVSRESVREEGRPAWAYTSPAWHEHNYQSQFTPIEPPPAAEPEIAGRIGFEFVQGNGFGPVIKKVI